MSRYIILLITLAVLSCNTQPKIHQDTKLSEELTGEGSELTMQRISLKEIDSLKRIDLNKQAIQKFDSAIILIRQICGLHYWHQSVAISAKNFNNVFIGWTN